MRPPKLNPPKVGVTELSGASWISYAKRALKATPDEKDELWDYMMKHAPRTANPMNKNSFVRRRQGTFGTPYRFAGQTSFQVGGDDPAAWPAVVRRALEHAKSEDPAPETLAAVHVNCYADGAGVRPHADDEDLFVPDSPIYSYTLLRDPTNPRSFQIYDNKTFARARGERNVPLLDLDLEDGSALVMGGRMQREFQHGVKTRDLARFVGQRRVNLTVRHVKPAAATGE